MREITETWLKKVWWRCKVFLNNYLLKIYNQGYLVLWFCLRKCFAGNNLFAEETKHSTSDWLKKSFLFSWSCLTQVRIAGRLSLVNNVDRLVRVDLRWYLVHLLGIPSSIFPNQLGHSHRGRNDSIRGNGRWRCRWVRSIGCALESGRILPLTKLAECLVNKTSFMGLVFGILSKRLLHRVHIQR